MKSTRSPGYRRSYSPLGAVGGFQQPTPECLQIARYFIIYRSWLLGSEGSESLAISAHSGLHCALLDLKSALDLNWVRFNNFRDLHPNQVRSKSTCPFNSRKSTQRLTFQPLLDACSSHTRVPHKSSFTSSSQSTAREPRPGRLPSTKPQPV